MIKVSIVRALSRHSLEIELASRLNEGWEIKAYSVEPQSPNYHYVILTKDTDNVHTIE